MPINRREFLRTGLTAGAGIGALASRPPWLHGLSHSEGPRRATPIVDAPPITDPTVRELALRAVEAARAAGATYADVRLTHTRELGFRVKEMAWYDMGVRALVDGYWGFAATALWTPDEAARLGREAVHQARTNALGRPRTVERSPIPVVPDGHWTMPVERDPFDVPDGEVQDFWRSLGIYVQRKSRADGINTTHVFWRQDKAFASSEGSYCTQRLYRTAGTMEVGHSVDGERHSIRSPIVAGAGRGWESIQQAPLREEIERLVAEIEEDLALPQKPVEVGRYDVVFDAQSMATLLDRTLGTATELDRALGHEANAVGTSYLNDPLGMRGRYQAGAPLLTVTADRSMAGGLATVKWDDEGVEPDQFALVHEGMLVDFQTHREAAGWLQAPRSHGCAAAPRAFDAPLIHSPNLTLAPGPEALDFDGLVSGMKKGLAVKQLSVHIDFQCLNGLGAGRRFGVYEVKDGKRVARITGAQFLFRAPELWTGLLALGGAASQRPFALTRSKGEPGQTTWHTVLAVPGLVKQVTTIEGRRR